MTSVNVDRAQEPLPRECPFCGKPAREANWRKHYGCGDPECGAHFASLSLEQWNTRPVYGCNCSLYGYACPLGKHGDLRQCTTSELHNRLCSVIQSPAQCGRCSCAQGGDPCPLGVQGAGIRCTADQLRDALLAEKALLCRARALVEKTDPAPLTNTYLVARLETIGIICDSMGGDAPSQIRYIARLCQEVTDKCG